MVVVHIPEAYSQLQVVSPKVSHDSTLIVGCEPLELNQVSLAYETSGLPSSSAAIVNWYFRIPNGPFQMAVDTIIV